MEGMRVKETSSVSIREVDKRNAVFTRKRWFILAASCLVNLCIGSLYAWSVFAVPMAQHLAILSGGEVQNLAFVFTIANAVGPITMISGGVVSDRLGPRWVILVGGLLFGGGMIMSGFATNFGMLVVSYGLGVGLGMGMVYGCVVSNAVKFFPDKRGLVGGITTASYGISSIIVPIVASMLIVTFDVTAAFKVLGFAMLVLICSSALLIAACPSDFVPEGWEPLDVSRGGGAVDKTWREMLADPVFAMMIIMMACGAFAGLMIISQASPIAQGLVGMSAENAAAAVAVLALFNTAGRIVSGWVSDRIGAVGTVRASFVISIVGMLLLFVSSIGSVVSFCGGMVFVGFAFGSVMGVYPGFTAARFGASHNSVNYGIMFIGFALAGLLGPMIMSGLYEANGTYQIAFVIAAMLAIFGFGLSFLFKKTAAEHTR